MRIRSSVVIAAFLAASVLMGQDAPAPAAPDADACMKHCKEMAAARQKADEARQADQRKMDAMFQEVRAALDTASKAKGEKKVAALELALEKLVAVHDAMHAQGPGPGMGGHHSMGMGSCCGGMADHHPMGMGSCCAEMAGMKDCPMMKGEAPAHH